MELYVFIILAFMVAVIISINLFTKIANSKYQKNYIKDDVFLKMQNAGPDLCEKNQEIKVKHHYAKASSWIAEVIE